MGFSQKVASVENFAVDVATSFTDLHLSFLSFLPLDAHSFPILTEFTLSPKSQLRGSVILSDSSASSLSQYFILSPSLSSSTSTNCVLRIQNRFGFPHHGLSLRMLHLPSQVQGQGRIEAVGMFGVPMRSTSSV
ncbi:hypothetical protein F2P56_009150 [Juglans regia]|uniref:Uncharacterized protein LOC109000703 n=2 Tax=Juglans regia TaxID=51240 RepID=A0A2I4FNK7_JUGRE|nr:uncharacterized protein LOC109000703 [Juglans regia]KAF5472430.1 hypothetical protein F2P56_009150 [Juglans regia]